MSGETIATIVIAALGGTGLTGLVTAWARRRRANADANVVEWRGHLEVVDANLKWVDSLRKDVDRLLERIRSLEAHSDATQQELAAMRAENLKLRHELTVVQVENEKLRERCTRLETENRRLTEARENPPTA